MMFTRRAVRMGAVVAGIALTLATALATPTAASTNGVRTVDRAVDSVQLAWPNDTFNVCSMGCGGQAVGGIIWGNRTSTVQGSVSDYAGNGTTVYFTAYAGSTKVDSDTRTAPPYVEDWPYNFTIGNPDLVGGFDRLKIQVCDTGSTFCGVPVHANRDGVTEHLVWP